MPVLLVALAALAAAAVGVADERRRGAAADRLARRIVTVILFGLLPFIVFCNLDRLRLTTAVGAGLAFGLLAAATSGAVAWLAGSRGLRLPRPTLGAVMAAAVAGNTGYLGLPVAAALLGFDDLPDAVAFDAIVSATSLFVGAFAIGAAFGTRAAGGRARAAAFLTRNPPLLAAVAGLLAPAWLVPDPLLDASRVALLAMAPLGFFVVGVTLAHERALRLTPPVGLAVAGKLVVMPGVMLGLAVLVPGVPQAYLLQAAMPCGVNTILVADTYGLDRGVAAAAIAWSTGLVLVAVVVAGAAA